MSQDLTLEELREMGAELERSLNWADMRCRRAIRELIALRESMEQEQQGMPWRQLHKNDLVKLDKLEARHERLRKAAETLAGYPYLETPIGKRISTEELRAALEGK